MAPFAGPAAIVSISPEARAAQANEPLPALLGQRQLTAADNLPRTAMPDETATGNGFPVVSEPSAAGNIGSSGRNGPEGDDVKSGITGADDGGNGAKDAEAIGAGQAKGTGEAEVNGAGQAKGAGEAKGARGAKEVPGDEATGTTGDPEEAEDAGSPGGARGATKEDTASEAPGGGSNELSAEEEQVVKELQARDREVRAHEAAHLAAAGGISKGGASFTYQSGPDGRQYAIGGEVNIDTSPEKDPRATVAKARQIQAAANAPAEPSGQDRAVAAAAAQMAAEAQAELAKQGQEEMAKALGGGKDDASKGQAGQQSSGSEPHGEGKEISSAARAAEPGKSAEAEQGKLAAVEPGRTATRESGKPGDPAAPANDPAAPANDSAAPANESTSSPPQAATPFVDPHEHPNGPADCGPCGKLASTRVTAYA